MVPLKYTVRSLRSRWVTSLMTVFGTALVVWASVLAFGLGAGLDHTLEVSGDPLDLIVLRKGATSETGSYLDEPKAREIAALPGIAQDASGQPLCSAEMVIVVNTHRRADGGRANLILRGLPAVGYQLRPNFKLVAGELPRTGVYEAITSRSIATRFEGAGLGEELDVLGAKFRIVGLFEAGDSAAESEVWTDLKVLGQVSTREGVVSSVQVRGADVQAVESLSARITNDEQFALDARSEASYYADQASAGDGIKFIGRLIAVVLTIGAMFAVANTMFGAVVSRAREIGTLRALGFSRLAVMTSFQLESLLLCLAGGALGCLATWPVNGLGTGTANWTTFSEITFAFRFGWGELLWGTALALIMGLVGGLLPSIRAVRMRIVDALREV